MWIDHLLESRIKRGTLILRFADGGVRRFGDGQPEAVWELENPGVLRRIAADPEFMLGQTYMDGAWSVPPDGLLPLLEVLMHAFPPGRARGRLLRWLLAPLQQWNRLTRSERNVSAHYDLDEAMFRQFLDPDMHYSCAYFEQPGAGLERAQQAKCELIRRKLCLSPGQRVLDIGCGWGGLAMYLAEHSGVAVTGLTLSREQQRVARQRVRERGLEDRVEILLMDYRRHSGVYQRVVSVGMFEHVGVPYYGQYFRTVRERLSADGVALIHTIGRQGPPGLTNAWIRRHIFPGGYIPALSEAAVAIQRSGLQWADVEILRRHYAYTLTAWNQRFQQVRDDWVVRRGERFCRMWEFYLNACAASFLWRGLVVFQLQLARSLDALPLTRDYLYASHADGGDLRAAG